MGLNDLFKTKKQKAREEEQRQKDIQIVQMLAKQEADRIAREQSEREAARLRKELEARNLENARKQQLLEEQAWRANEVKLIQAEKDEREREAKLAEKREKDRLNELRKRRIQRLKSTEPENLRALRDKVRRKYQLDIDIWAERGVRLPDRPLVEKKMEEADALLGEIISTVSAWEEGHNIFKPNEWKLAEQVKKRLLTDGIRRWSENPPWNEN